MTEMLLVLVGKPGIGKTLVRRPLAEKLRARALGPDDHPHRWDWAVRQVDATRRVVLECCKVPRAIRNRLPTIPDSMVVELTASPEVQRKRLYAQGHDPEIVDRRMVETEGYGYQDELVPDLSVSCEGDPDEVVEQIITELQRSDSKRALAQR